MKDFCLNIYDDGLKSSYDDISAVEWDPSTATVIYEVC